MLALNVRDRSSFIRITGVLFLVYAASGLTAPLFSNYVKSLGADTSQLGLTLASFQAASLASQYWWGQRSDRLGRRRPILLAGTGGLALAYFAYTGVGSYQWLFPIRILEGVAFAAYSTGSLALIGDLLEDQERRGRFMGQYRMMGSLAFAAAALTGGWVADTYGIRVPILTAACCFVIGMFLTSQINETARDSVATSRRGVATQDASEPQTPQRGVSTNMRILLPFLGLSFAWFVGMGSVASLWPVFMKNGGYSQTQISGLWGLAAAGEVFWLFVAGILADRIGRKWVIIIGVAGMACVYTAYTFATGFFWFVGIQMVRSFTYSTFETPALLYATSLGLRQQRGRLAGLYYTASAIGGVAGSILGGQLATWQGMPTMFRIIAAFMFVIAVVAAVVMPGKE